MHCRRFDKEYIFQVWYKHSLSCVWLLSSIFVDKEEYLIYIRKYKMKLFINKKDYSRSVLLIYVATSLCFIYLYLYSKLKIVEVKVSSIRNDTFSIKTLPHCCCHYFCTMLFNLTKCLDMAIEMWYFWCHEDFMGLKFCRFGLSLGILISLYFTAIMAMLRSFHGVLIGGCLGMDCASTAFFVLLLHLYAV
jgi:hypothetical protein